MGSNSIIGKQSRRKNVLLEMTDQKVILNLLFRAYSAHTNQKDSTSLWGRSNFPLGFWDCGNGLEYRVSVIRASGSSIPPTANNRTSFGVPCLGHFFSQQTTQGLGNQERRLILVVPTNKLELAVRRSRFFF